MASSSSSSQISSEISIKLFVDKKAQKVLFAESNKVFVDFLFQIITLPIGTVVKLLKKYSMVGSVENIYDSHKNSCSMYMRSDQSSKYSMLDPKIANDGVLLPKFHCAPMAEMFYTCFDVHYVTDDPTTICLNCGTSLDIFMSYVAGSGAAESTTKGGDFVTAVINYMVMDDLEVKPLSIGAAWNMFKKVKEEGGDLEVKEVSNLGMEEGLMLLKASFETKNVLTTVFLSGSRLNEDGACK